MSEKFSSHNLESSQLDEKEYRSLFSRARQSVEALSRREREHLTKFGYDYLDVSNKNEYKAMNTFAALQDFDGLQPLSKLKAVVTYTIELTILRCSFAK